MAVWSIVKLSELELTRIDAEFYKPEYLTAKKIVGNRKFKSYGVSVLHPAEFTRRYTDNGLFLLLAKNNRDNYYDWGNKNFIDNKLKAYISRNKLEFGDVTITRSGANYGQTSVISSEIDSSDIYACAELLVLRSTSISGHLVSTYLNSKIGKALIERGAYGSAQPHIAPNYIKEIPFPEYLISHESVIFDFITKSRNLIAKSAEFFNSATIILEAKLGLDKLIFKKPPGYTAQLSEVEISRRLDSEYYNPAAREIIKKITSTQHTQVLDNFHVGGGFPWNSTKFLPDNSGEPVVRIRNIKPSYIVSSELTSIIPEYEYSIGIKKAKKGDIVVGMDGIKYFYASLLEDECHVNQRVCHLSPKDNSTVSAEYAVFIINSLVGQAQLMRDMTVATTVGHITNRDIARLVIPTISQEFHDKITSLVRQSIDKKEESKRLLEAAKTRVEQLIEDAARTRKAQPTCPHPL